jgi:hypothetical protein
VVTWLPVNCHSWVSAGGGVTVAWSNMASTWAEFNGIEPT